MLLAADIGGTSSRLYVLENDGRVVEKTHFAGYGLTYDNCDEDIPEISDALEAICGKFKINAAAVNIGGKNKNQILRIFRQYVSQVRVYRESEGKSAFAADPEADIILLAGTGAIAVAHNGDRQLICGGWGADVSDKGSGYDIGLQVLKNSILELDGTKELSALTKQVTGMSEPICALGDGAEIVKKRDEVRLRFFPIERRNVASYCVVASELCKKGDPTALSIFENAGCELAELVLSAYRKLAFTKPVNILVSGGLVNVKEYWGKSFIQTLENEITIKNVSYETDGIMKAMINTAVKMYKEEVK